MTCGPKKMYCESSLKHNQIFLYFIDNLMLNSYSRHPLVVVDFSLHFCLRMSSEYTREFVIKFLPAQFS